jgi:hypothetical protein
LAAESHTAAIDRIETIDADGCLLTGPAAADLAPGAPPERRRQAS